MAIPDQLTRGLRVPVIAAPMFLVSDPGLVIACCKAGVIGSFPSLNLRTLDEYEAWLDQIIAALGPDDAPWAVNLIVHPQTNPRLYPDLELTVRKKPPLVITSFGAVPDVVDAVHSYGGLVFHDVISVRHAEKAIEAGVDGLVLVCAGAGGHTGTLNPFSFVNEIRRFYGGPLALSGGLSTGRDVAAAVTLGADFGYMGTRFIATRESAADADYKRMILDSGGADVALTRSVSGVPANFLARSLSQYAIDPASVGPLKAAADTGAKPPKAWSEVWSAGQVAGAIDDLPSVAELTDRIVREYEAARR
jgi:nitronate monooxygenase